MKNEKKSTRPAAAEASYNRFPPEAVFRSYTPRPLAEEELWQGVRLSENGRNRLTGCSMFDCFVSLVSRYYVCGNEFYAKRLGISAPHFNGAIVALTGMTAREWVDGYTLLCAKELLRTRKYEVREVAKMLGFGTPQGFNQFFVARQGETPKWWG